MSEAAKDVLLSLKKLHEDTGEVRFHDPEITLVYGIKLPNNVIEELDNLGYIDYHDGVAPYLIFHPERVKNFS